MVSYEKWVSIVRSVAGAKGADLNDFETNSELVSVAADIWNDGEPQDMNGNQARAYAESEITVT